MFIWYVAEMHGCVSLINGSFFIRSMMNAW